MLLSSWTAAHTVPMSLRAALKRQSAVIAPSYVSNIMKARQFRAAQQQFNLPQKGS